MEQPEIVGPIRVGLLEPQVGQNESTLVTTTTTAKPKKTFKNEAARLKKEQVQQKAKGKKL